ncbi:MAG: isochorismate synthase [bacterium]|nr:isochorismate synthase [bacterium]
MSSEEKHLILDALIERDVSFAICRLPGEQTPRFVMQQSGSPLRLDDLESLTNQQGFVVAPFRITSASPLLVIRADRRELPRLSDLLEMPLPNHSPQPDTEDDPEPGTSGKKEYRERFQRFMQPLRNGELEKVVLSRYKTVARKKGFSPGRTFWRAVSKYERSCVYLFHTRESGSWLGSTPEILLTGKGNNWQTVALAGTRYPGSGQISWDDKNLREQHLVTSYLLRQLSTFGITPEINGPYTVRAGSLAHLKTDFRFLLPGNTAVGSLLQALHPTPAVSGLPKEEAFRFIQNHEGYDRRYYTGFLGMLNREEETTLYVNLRCLQIGKSRLTLYAGSGLLASSSCKEEWKETEQKTGTMGGII